MLATEFFLEFFWLLFTKPCGLFVVMLWLLHDTWAGTGLEPPFVFLFVHAWASTSPIEAVLLLNTGGVRRFRFGAVACLLYMAAEMAKF